MPREKESAKLWSLGPRERRVVRMWVKLIHGMEPIFGGYKNLILIEAAVSLCGFFFDSPRSDRTQLMTLKSV